MTKAGQVVIHTDGASRGNPGAAAFAYTIERDGQPPIEEAECLGRMTNNQAEYTAVVRALEHALEIAPDSPVSVYSDSELMVKQLSGEYRVKNEELKPLYDEVKDLTSQFKQPVRFHHVRRAMNKRADELCNEALDGLRSSMRALEKTYGPKPPATPTPPPRPAEPSGLHGLAVARLREAQLAWRRGEASPTPEDVWKELTELLRRQWTALLDGASR